MIAPVYWPWDPRDELPPGDANPGIDGAITGWNNLVGVFTNIIPQALDELIALTKD